MIFTQTESGVAEIQYHCQCEAAGFCNRHGITKNVREHQLCQGVKCTPEQQEEYWLAWEAGRYRGQPNEPKTDIERSQPSVIPAVGIGEGPGTELKALLKRWGIDATDNCPCNRRAAEMNRRGVEWCKSNIPTIIEWLREEAERRKLPFSATAAKLLIRRAIKNAEKKQPPAPELVWSYGLTTVPSRLNTLLPRTLDSLRNAGFESPVLYVDGMKPSEAENFEFYGLEAVLRPTPVGAFGNWMLSLWETYLRNPRADRFIIFQDDFVTYRNLRTYLERTPYPTRGYCNLYTFRENDKLLEGQKKTGWFKASQNGRGAVALMFDRESLWAVMSQKNMIAKPHGAKEGTLPDGIDGGVITAAKKAGIHEYVHNPTLVQHTGDVSSIRTAKQQHAKSFRGEDFDALELVG